MFFRAGVRIEDSVGVRLEARQVIWYQEGSLLHPTVGCMRKVDQ